MNEYRFEDIHTGLTESFTVTVTVDMMEKFRDITGDVNPMHTDPEFASEHGYEREIAYGMLTSSFLSTLAGVYLPGRNSLIRTVEVKFPKPVMVGDELTVSGEVTDVNEEGRFFDMKIAIRNQNGDKVCRGRMQIGVLE